MTRYGYFLSCEEYDPASLVRQAVLAEQAGFEALWISDHFHPWLDEQGHSPFVWSIIGAISQVTSLPVTTAVTCPTTRIHPAVIAQAAATASLLTGGKFTLGVGTGEALNEHITGAKWPAAAERRDMLEEAVTIIARLFTGEQLTHHGTHYQVDTARLYSVPDQPPPIYVSGFGEHSARLAAKIADGYICMGPQADLIKLYRDEGGGDRLVQGGIKGCWAPDENTRQGVCPRGCRRGRASPCTCAVAAREMRKSPCGGSASKPSTPGHSAPPPARPAMTTRARSRGCSARSRAGLTSLAAKRTIATTT